MIRPEPDSSPLARASQKIEDAYFARADAEKMQQYREAIAALRRTGKMRPDQTVRQYIDEQLGIAPSPGYVDDGKPLDLDPDTGAAIEAFFDGVYRQYVNGEDVFRESEPT